MMRCRALLVMVCAAAVSAACVSDRQYRITQSVYYEQLKVENFDPTQVDTREDTAAYRLAFVEFNDKGEMFDKGVQLARAISEIEAAKKRGKTLVALFVHGWKNNADLPTGNVWGWRQVLAGLSNNFPDQQILGLYIGWRGASVSAPILKEFTFFTRRPKSQSVGAGQMVGALQQIMQAIKGPQYTDDSATSVLVGHSFGGAVLEAAVTPELQKAMRSARQENRAVRWPADLIILLNEAQEAERSYPLIVEMEEALRPREKCGLLPDGSRFQRPAIISISSTGDYATRGAFPGAQLISRPFRAPSYEGNDPLMVGASRLYYGTTAHVSELRSHLLVRPEDPTSQPALAECRPSLRARISMLRPDAAQGDTEDPRFLLVEDPNAKNRTPYWVMQMPPVIVPDHSTIFTQVFRDFLISLMGLSQFTVPHDALK